MQYLIIPLLGGFKNLLEALLVTHEGLPVGYEVFFGATFEGHSDRQKAVDKLIKKIGNWVNFHVTPSTDTGQQPFTFKMLFLWAREDGEWWSHGEMFVPGKFALDQPSH